MDVTVTLECEKGHLSEEIAIGAVIEDGSVRFLATSGWEFCDDCEDDENGEYVLGSTGRSEESRMAGFKQVREALARHKAGK